MNTNYVYTEERCQPGKFSLFKIRTGITFAMNVAQNLQKSAFAYRCSTCMCLQEIYTGLLPDNTAHRIQHGLSFKRNHRNPGN